MKSEFLLSFANKFNSAFFCVAICWPLTMRQHFEVEKFQFHTEKIIPSL